MWIEKNGKYGIGVVLSLLGAVSGVIQDENFSDLGQLTFNMILSINWYQDIPIYTFIATILAKLLSRGCFTPSFYTFISPVEAVSGADIFSDPGQVTFSMVR